MLDVAFIFSIIYIIYKLISEKFEKPYKPDHNDFLHSPEYQALVDKESYEIDKRIYGEWYAEEFRKNGKYNKYAYERNHNPVD